MGPSTGATSRRKKPIVDGALRRRIQRRLLGWFRRFQRPLPWRKDRDPYHIWVSEVMLQQTQAATVVRYFEPFLTAFPTIADLANADEQEVLRRWEGLGYYRRARNLHRAARQLLASHGNRFPNERSALGGLPGLGRYTLNAILSQAFDERLPILEANSRRVLCRLLGRRDDPARAPAERWLWQAAEELLPVHQVGDFNQALMELGALVCTPAHPRCQSCPLASDCEARRLGLQEVIPPRSAPVRPITIQEAGVVVYRQGKILLVQRTPQGRWAGLWEFPHGPVQEGEACETAASRLLSELTGVRARMGPELMTLRHGIMHYRITLVCFEANYSGGMFRRNGYQDGCWIVPAGLASYPFSAPQRRLAQALIEHRQKRFF